MTRTRLPVLAALAALGLLGGCAEKRGAPPAATAAPTAASPAPSDPESLLPGVSLEGLTPEQKKVVADFAQDEFCYCGCPHTLSQCLRGHKGCHHAPRMARLAVRLAGAGLTKDEILRLVTEYYASFDAAKRARLELDGFGPPLGDVGARVTLVEFSDFTCPYCQQLRPELEKFVEAHHDRIRLVYKPFPIESHPNAVEAAQAGEWARDQGFFWPMHDLLFTNAHAHEADDLASYAQQLGGDPEALREALASGKYLDKIRASQAEGRGAGMRGTPTLFFDGRMLSITDYSDAFLQFTLEDEEEWVANRGWARD